jgi:lysophospholipase L1-like esterase
MISLASWNGSSRVASVSRRWLHAVALFACLDVALAAPAPEPATLALSGDWQIKVTARNADGQPVTATLDVTPPALLTVKAEKFATLPIFNPRAGGWVKGAALATVRAQECTTPHLLDPESLELRTGPEPDAPPLIRGTDYEADLAWATIGRLTNGVLKEGQPVFATYRHGLLRLDSIVLTGAGSIVLRPGEAKSAAPVPPALAEGERRLANVWLPGRIRKLEPEHLFLVLETVFPEPPGESPTSAEKFTPRTMQKLRSGQPLRILAWGDSVTVGTFVPDWEHQRWQDQFVTRLRARFPKAQIELITEAWGGRNTGSYLAEPSGSEHNYAEKVLAQKPDLIVSEFVNDAGLNEEQVEQQYGKLLADFKAIGAEWIILSPHYVRPEWMGLTKEREIDDDPRPYVKGLRQFAAKHQLALADASARYGRLWRQGIPYSTLMLNSINHPDARGMHLFAESLMALFPDQTNPSAQ